MAVTQDPVWFESSVPHRGVLSSHQIRWVRMQNRVLVTVWVWLWIFVITCRAVWEDLPGRWRWPQQQTTPGCSHPQWECPHLGSGSPTPRSDCPPLSTIIAYNKATQNRLASHCTSSLILDFLQNILTCFNRHQSIIDAVTLFKSSPETSCWRPKPWSKQEVNQRSFKPAVLTVE